METSILVVDQSVDYRTALHDFLANLNYNVFLANNGAQALDIYQRHDVDILLADWDMPEMDGLELCWRVRSEDVNLHTFLILMSATTDDKKKIAALDAGVDDFLSKPIEFPSLRARVRSAERLCKMHRHLSKLMRTDYLTGACNRRHFMEQFEKSFLECVKERSDLSFIIFDIDHFKKINDSYGHTAGDGALCRFSEICMALTNPPNLFGRMGGEEFCMLMPRASIEEAAALAEQIRVGVQERTLFADHHAFKMTVSAGISGLHPQVTDVRQLIHEADESLYFAKASGRNRVVLCGNGGMALKARYFVM